MTSPLAQWGGAHPRPHPRKGGRRCAAPPGGGPFQTQGKGRSKEGE